MPNIVSHTLGRTGLTVTNIALGTSPLGSSPNLYGYAVDEERALDTVRAFKRVLGLSTIEEAQAQGGSGAAVNFWLYLRNSLIVATITTVARPAAGASSRLGTASLRPYRISPPTSTSGGLASSRR